MFDETSKSNGHARHVVHLIPQVLYTVEQVLVKAGRGIVMRDAHMSGLITLISAGDSRGHVPGIPGSPCLSVGICV